VADFGDLAQRISELDLEQTLQRRAAARVPRLCVDDCEGCGDSIPLARQNAVPGVRLCIDCQTKIERNGR
jgi:phage/conjugal plasmid C-4 type zinc finger TraR family protein